MATYSAYRHIELDKVGAGKKRIKESESSDSESDEDYVPSELKDDDVASEEHSDASEEEEEEEEDGRNENVKVGRGKKRRKATGRCKKRKVTAAEPAEEPEIEKPKPAVNIDDIWSEFKKDCGVQQTVVKKDDQKQESSPKIEAEVPKTKTVTQLFEFAGEAVEVKKEVSVDAPEPPTIKRNAGPSRGRGGGGLASVLGQLGGKNKLSVLEKSKLDWEGFKEKEGITEELQKHNKGKDGYLEKQDFLQRTDLRQFEIEKAMRSSRRLK